MGFIMIDVMEHESELLSPILQTVNLVGALVFALIPFLVRSLILSDARIKARLERDVYLEVLAINPQTRELDPERLERIKALEPFEQRLLSLPTFHWFIYAISLASNLMVAGMGFTLTVLGGTTTPVLILGILSIGLNLPLFNGLDALLNRSLSMRHQLNIG